MNQEIDCRQIDAYRDKRFIKPIARPLFKKIIKKLPPTDNLHDALCVLIRKDLELQR